MRLVAVALLVTATASAGPLGQLWKQKLAKGDTCGYADLPDSLVAANTAAVTTYDRKTGAPSPLVPAVKLAAKDYFYIQGTYGDTLVLGTGLLHTVFGIDDKTGAVRWQRGPDPKAKKPFVSVDHVGDDALVRVEDFEGPGTVVLERIDPGTGASKWKSHVQLKRRDREVHASAKRIYLVGMDYVDTRRDITIIALDRDGTQLWTLEDQAASGSPKWFVVGDDLVSITDNRIRPYRASDGAHAKEWQVNWNSFPTIAEGALYATPVDDSIEARDPITGNIRWTAKLPPRGGTGVSGIATTVGVSGGLVYVSDGTTLSSFDVTGGGLHATLGIAGIGDGLSDPHIHAGSPAITMCAKRSFVAFDSSVETPEHHVTVKGKIHCKNCENDTVLEVRLGGATVTPSRDGRFTIETTASGTLALQVRDASFPVARDIKKIDFDKDATRDLHTIDVTVPEMAPGED